MTAPGARRGGKMKEAAAMVRGERSWVLANGQVELAVTEKGGHMAPVFFFRDTDKPLQPYYVSPWQGKGVTTGVPVLDVLRGDFFCMPFGGGETFRGEKHPAHGETAGSRWEMVGVQREGGVSELTLGMSTRARPGRVTKRLSIMEGHNAIYIRHDLEGYTGRMCVSHHATLAVPEAPGSLLLSTSPTRLCRVAPREALANTGNEYYFLEPGAAFTRLDRVPTIWKRSPFADISTHPVVRGFMDLVAVFPKPGKTPAWTAVVMPGRGCLWYALRDVELLPQTVFWMSNAGRHGAPWNGVNRCLGVEDGCANFTHGLEASVRQNDLSKAGIPTSISLSPKRARRITHIQGVARIPKGFDRVKSVEFAKRGLVFTSMSGKKADADVRWSFLQTGDVRIKA
jgi:hypothetical protein